MGHDADEECDGANEEEDDDVEEDDRIGGAMLYDSSRGTFEDLLELFKQSSCVLSWDSGGCSGGNRSVISLQQQLKSQLMSMQIHFEYLMLQAKDNGDDSRTRIGQAKAQLRDMQQCSIVQPNSF